MMVPHKLLQDFFWKFKNQEIISRQTFQFSVANLPKQVGPAEFPKQEHCPFVVSHSPLGKLQVLSSVHGKFDPMDIPSKCGYHKPNKIIHLVCILIGLPSTS